MARPLRIEFEDAIYHLCARGNARQPVHVMSRGDRREAIFHDDADRVEFLTTLGRASLKSDRLKIGSAS
jgi:hypothetical protein